jgi:hypothetical protein
VIIFINEAHPHFVFSNEDLQILWKHQKMWRDHKVKTLPLRFHREAVLLFFTLELHFHGGCGLIAG